MKKLTVLALIDFLNHLLPYHHHITDLTYMRHEKLGSTPVDRKVVYDLYCQNDKGERFIVELQKARQNSLSIEASTTLPLPSRTSSSW
ncbi:MAG: PD-(D/E)XK nuclease family transposase [Deinococcales bacterium]